MRFFASQLNAIADLAYADDDRPWLACLHFDADAAAVFATNGHRMVIVDLKTPPPASFSINRQHIKLWCANAPRNTIVKVDAKPPASDGSYEVQLLFTEWSGVRSGVRERSVATVSFRERRREVPPDWKATMPLPLRVRGGWIDKPEAEQHGLNAQYIDGIGELGRQFVPSGYGLSLLHSGTREPLIYGFRGADHRRVLILTMPMLVDKPSHATLVEPAP